MSDTAAQAIGCDMRLGETFHFVPSPIIIFLLLEKYRTHSHATGQFLLEAPHPIRNPPSTQGAQARNRGKVKQCLEKNPFI